MDTETRTDTFMDAILRGWHPLYSARARTAELNACSDHELSRMARDLALSPRDLRQVTALGADAARLLPRRMAALDLDFDEVSRTQPHVMWDLQQLCTLCDSKKRCARDLATNPDSPGWRDYCPNEDTLTALKAQLPRMPEIRSPGLAPAAEPGRAAAAPAVRPERRSIWAWLSAFFLLACVWLALDNLGPRRLTVLLDRATASTPSTVDTTATIEPRAVTCLDASCLDERQLTALATLTAFQEQGAARSSAAQVAAVLRAAPELRQIRNGEAAVCQDAGGTASYGPMFQVGCTEGVVQSGRPLGYSTCRPMAAGGVCFLK